MTQGELVQVIDGQGQFQTEAVQNFVAQHGLVAAKTDYQVVAIMGPQSSGKSTLLNHVVGVRRQLAAAAPPRRGRTLPSHPPLQT